MEAVQSLGKGGESAFIFIQSYLITSKTHMLEIIFADAKYFNKPEYIYEGHDGKSIIYTFVQVWENKIPNLFPKCVTL